MWKNVKFISNNIEQTYSLIKENLKNCLSFKFNVAFISYSGYQIFASLFHDLNDKKIHGQILTTTYKCFTDPKIIKQLSEFKSFEIKVVDYQTIVDKTIDEGYHPKCYIFEYQDMYKVIIGSVNMTESALKTNVEWSFLVEIPKNEVLLDNIVEEFNFIWKNVHAIDEDFLNRYTNEYNEKQELLIAAKKQKHFVIEPNSIQARSLVELAKLRGNGENRALIIAATGVGKTYLAAFDVKATNPTKTLFIVHREEILINAKESFENIITKKCGIFNGHWKEHQADIVFASIQTIHNNLDQFEKDQFQYIIVDEAHHIGANTYQKTLNYFKPQFLLGMTATPDRTDGYNIYEFFNNKIAQDVRLKQAIDEKAIVPFHYFGISDITEASLDLWNIDKTKIDKIAKALMIVERVDEIIKQIKIYGYEGRQMHCLGFCINKAHAKYMADEFNKRNICSEYLTSDTPKEIRKTIIDRFNNEEDPLSVIFSVDIFNEGVDIPKTNLILLLRPTDSPIVFIQQLGRGLRNFGNKTFLTVLDFIGNHNKIYMIPYAFMSMNEVSNEKILEYMVRKDFLVYSNSNIHIEFDQISKDHILKSIGNINFDNEKFIKQEYYDFKRIMGNRPILYMMEYLIDGSPDLIRIIKKYKTYLKFLIKVESNEKIRGYLLNEKFVQFIEFLSSFLPIRRINEFALLFEMISNGITKIDIHQAKEIISKYIKDVDDVSTIHSLEILNYNLLDSKELTKQKYKIFELKNDIFNFSYDFLSIIEDINFKKYILDCLEFGINKYIQSFQDIAYIEPFLKLHQTYSMRDAAICINWNKKLTAFSRRGVFEYKNNFYFFVDLIKNDENKDRVKYNDGFDLKSREIFYWKSADNTSQNTKAGSRIIEHGKWNINIHLFVRKYDSINNHPQPYYYLGKADVISYSGNKPICFKLRLHNKINDEIFYQLTNSKKQ